MTFSSVVLSGSTAVSTTNVSVNSTSASTNELHSTLQQQPIGKSFLSPTQSHITSDLTQIKSPLIGSLGIAPTSISHTTIMSPKTTTTTLSLDDSKSGGSGGGGGVNMQQLLSASDTGDLLSLPLGTLSALSQQPQPNESQTFSVAHPYDQEYAMNVFSSASSSSSVIGGGSARSSSNPTSRSNSFGGNFSSAPTTGGGLLSSLPGDSGAIASGASPGLGSIGWLANASSGATADLNHSNVPSAFGSVPSMQLPVPQGTSIQQSQSVQQQQHQQPYYTMPGGATFGSHKQSQQQQQAQKQQQHNLMFPPNPYAIPSYMPSMYPPPHFDFGASMRQPHGGFDHSLSQYPPYPPAFYQHHQQQPLYGHSQGGIDQNVMMSLAQQHQHQQQQQAQMMHMQQMSFGGPLGMPHQGFYGGLVGGHIAGDTPLPYNRSGTSDSDSKEIGQQPPQPNRKESREDVFSDAASLAPAPGLSGAPGIGPVRAGNDDLFSFQDLRRDSQEFNPSDPFGWAPSRR